MRVVAAVALLLLVMGPADAAPKSAVAGTWALRMPRPSGYTPRVAVAIVNLAVEDDAWSGDITFRPPMMGGRTLPLSRVDVDGKTVRFRFPAGEAEARFDARLRAGALEGTCTWGGSYDFEATRHERFEERRSRGSSFPRGDPSDLDLDPNLLGVLVETAGVLDTHALIVLKDGRVVAERYYGEKVEPIHLMSVTKFVVAMAAAMLLDEGAIPSLDAPLSTWFPEWSEGRKGKVTLRHVLSHTSGIEHRPKAHLLNRQRDKVKFVRSSRVTDEPGSVLAYNNEAVALLSGILEDAGDRPVDAYLKKALFEPLKIRKWRWDRDGAGHTLTYANLAMTAGDLAKVGQLIAQGGSWEGKPLFPAAWIETLGSPGSPLSPSCGLLWWLKGDYAAEEVVQTDASLARFAEAGFEAVAKLRPLTDRMFKPRWSYFQEIRRRGLLDGGEMEALEALVKKGIFPFESKLDVIGYYHTGDQGQFLAVYPGWNLVAVRLRHARPARSVENPEFGDFLTLLERCVKR